MCGVIAEMRELPTFAREIKRETVIKQRRESEKKPVIKILGNIDNADFVSIVH